jgi:hypothetical protein
MNYGATIATAKYAEESDVDYRIESTLQKKKVKKPGFIKRWFAKMSREAWEDEKRQSQERESKVSINRLSNSLVSSGPPNIDQPDRALHFTVYNANGGRVIETRRYNTKTDRNATGLYVITSDKDFGREIDKIITMEALK